MKTTPLPPTREDPAIVAGYALRSTYTNAQAAARADLSLSESGTAQLLHEVWRVAVEQQVALRSDFENRHAARVAELAAVVPLGPDVPANASAADRAVLIQSFRMALEDARAQTRDERIAALRDALRFGDDVVLRAVLTAASDDGQSDVVNVWAVTRPELAAQLTELTALRDGYVTAGMWARQAFAPLDQPSERATLVQVYEESGRLTMQPPPVPAGLTARAVALMSSGPGAYIPAPNPSIGGPGSQPAAPTAPATASALLGVVSAVQNA